MRELGYIEGKNIVIEWRGADGIRDRQPALVAGLISIKVDVIVTSGGGPTRSAKKATSTIPIVFAQDTDPIGNGFVASLARPGGNITGLSRLAPELTGKQVEILKEVVPGLSRLAVFATSTSRSYGEVLKESELAAGVFRIKLLRAGEIRVKRFDMRTEER
jgi:putative ABC transport system substrate-binding protein